MKKATPLKIRNVAYQKRNLTSISVNTLLFPQTKKQASVLEARNSSEPIPAREILKDVLNNLQIGGVSI